MAIHPKLQLLIEHFFKSFNEQDVFCEVLDRDGNIVFINDYFAKQCFSWDHPLAIGKNIFNIYLSRLGNGYTQSYYDAIVNIYQNVFNHKKSTSFYAYVRDNHGNSCVRQANIYPIIDTTNGEVLGSYALSMLVNPLQILDSLRQSAQTSSEHHDPQSLVPNLKLTIREHEVLFLLLYNFSQEEIAKILQVTRSTIQKVISTRLCEKFNLPTSNSKELIAKAHALKLYNYFPPSLLGKHLIELSKDKSIITALRRSLKGY